MDDQSNAYLYGRIAMLELFIIAILRETSASRKSGIINYINNLSIDSITENDSDIPITVGTSARNGFNGARKHIIENLSDNPSD